MSLIFRGNQFDKSVQTATYLGQNRNFCGTAVFFTIKYQRNSMSMIVYNAKGCQGCVSKMFHCLASEERLF